MPPKTKRLAKRPLVSGEDTPTIKTIAVEPKNPGDEPVRVASAVASSSSGGGGDVVDDHRMLQALPDPVPAYIPSSLLFNPCSPRYSPTSPPPADIEARAVAHTRAGMIAAAPGTVYVPETRLVECDYLRLDVEYSDAFTVHFHLHSPVREGDLVFDRIRAVAWEHLIIFGNINYSFMEERAKLRRFALFLLYDELTNFSSEHLVVGYNSKKRIDIRVLCNEILARVDQKASAGSFMDATAWYDVLQPLEPLGPLGDCEFPVLDNELVPLRGLPLFKVRRSATFVLKNAVFDDDD